MDDESQFPVPPEFWPELVAAPYCMRAGCPNPASHVELSQPPKNGRVLDHMRVLVRAYCRWHTQDQRWSAFGVVLSIDEYREWRAGARVRAALQQRSNGQDLDTFELETLIALVAGKLQWGGAVSAALEGLKARRLVSGSPYMATVLGRQLVEMTLLQPGVISSSLLTGQAHVCGMFCGGQDSRCDMARRPPQTARELAQLPRQPR